MILLLLLLLYFCTLSKVATISEIIYDVFISSHIETGGRAWRLLSSTNSDGHNETQHNNNIVFYNKIYTVLIIKGESPQTEYSNTAISFILNECSLSFLSIISTTWLTESAAHVRVRTLKRTRLKEFLVSLTRTVLNRLLGSLKMLDEFIVAHHKWNENRKHKYTFDLQVH